MFLAMLLHSVRVLLLRTWPNKHTLHTLPDLRCQVKHWWGLLIPYADTLDGANAGPKQLQHWQIWELRAA